MRFQTPLIPATLLKRYKRFLADIRLDDGTQSVAHCPNPGSMMGLNQPGLRIWVEPNNDPKKKLRYGWRLVELPQGHWAGIDATAPNRIVAEALQHAHIPELAGYDSVRPEQTYGNRSRIDFLLTSDGRPDTYVEVKNVHLRRTEDWAEFPDSITARGAKHLDELGKVVQAGGRAVMLYLIQRTDCMRFCLARDLDPTYAVAFERAQAAGVEMLCYGTAISPEEIKVTKSIPMVHG